MNSNALDNLEKHIFFHGTSLEAAKAIAKHGFRVWLLTMNQSDTQARETLVLGPILPATGVLLSGLGLLFFVWQFTLEQGF